MKPMNNYKNALFINFGGIGDEILFFPTLKDFKEDSPECKISLLLEPRSAGCIYLTNTIDEVVKYDVKSGNKIKAFIDLLSLIRKGKYDIVISSGGNIFISILLFLSGVKIRIGYDAGLISRILLTSAVKLNKFQYAGSMYHDLLKGINITKEANYPEVILSQDAVDTAKTLLNNKEKPIIAIHPGVSKLSVKKNIIKSWSDQKWADLIFRLLETNNYTVILTGGPDDEDTIFKLRNLIEQKNIDLTNFIDLFGKTKNLIELAAIIKLSDILICVDSAPMHISVGTNTKTIGIFGPTDEKKLLPVNENFVAIKNSSLECRPCLWDKRNEVCEKLSCLDISIEEVLSTINTLNNKE
jgi:ADP-heptose:LPS heptosyltransferase